MTYKQGTTWQRPVWRDHEISLKIIIKELVFWWGERWGGCPVFSFLHGLDFRHGRVHGWVLSNASIVLWPSKQHGTLITPQNHHLGRLISLIVWKQFSERSLVNLEQVQVLGWFPFMPVSSDGFFWGFHFASVIDHIQNKGRWWPCENVYTPHLTS